MRTQFAAYVYPGWHRSPFRPGLDEWTLLDSFRPYYEGHARPARPLAGRYDDTDPATAARQIREASRHGVDAFSYFAYFRPDGFVLCDPIDAAIDAANLQSTSFGVSLTLCLRLPHHELPLPLAYGHWRDAHSAPRIRPGLQVREPPSHEAPPLRWAPPAGSLADTVLEKLDVEVAAHQPAFDARVARMRATVPALSAGESFDQRRSTLSFDEVVRLFEGWACRYAARPGHWRIAGRPVCSLLNVGDFVHSYGLDGFRFIVAVGRRVLLDTIGVDPFFIGVVGEATRANAELVAQLPLDGATGYGLLPEWQGPPVQDYAELVERRVRDWYRFQEWIAPIPFFPVACAGWDATVRGAWAGDLRAVRGFPWRPVVEGVTPELFGSFVRRAVRFNEKCHPAADVVFLHAWNEWTESAAIEPSDRYGYRLLEEIQSAKKPTHAVAPAVSMNDEKESRYVR